MRATAAILLLLTSCALAACGSGSGGAAQAPARGATAAADGRPWLYVWRNFEFTGIPDELSVYRDGSLRYRNLLHTQRGIHVRRGRLTAGQLATLRHLLARVDLRRADSAGETPRRSGFRWIIRSGGRTGTAADGHLHGPIRPLVARLRALMDRLQTE
jgi:hypothetical protein